MESDELRERLHARGYSVELGPGVPGSNAAHVAVVWRDGLSRGYFGPTEVEALQKAWEQTSKDIC
jgi:hypothetical protein